VVASFFFNKERAYLVDGMMVSRLMAIISKPKRENGQKTSDSAAFFS
jgi:hypothetical protein